MTFTLGETVGTYRIVSQLGQGGMATVYKAYHASLNRHVAIKVLHPSFNEDETFYSRFKREAQIVAQLEHPHIVPVYDFSEHAGNPYLVMKFIEGDTLKHRIRRQKMTLDDTIKYMDAVAQALTYAHNRDILHRDIKPSNVMVDKDDFPYLADFGLARIASTGESTMSQDVLIGTPHYISPEQAKGVKSLGPATDIYSLGIMLYEVVVGRVPFSADTPYAIVHDHIYKPLPLPTLVNPTVPPAIEIVLLKALSKQPEDRYASATGLIEAFKQAVAESQISELSAASVRLDKFEEASAAAAEVASQKTPTPPPTGQIDDQLMAHVRAAITEALATETAARTEAAIPSPNSYTQPYPSYPTYPTPSQWRRRGARRGFWMLLGSAAFVFICIASLAVMINALNDPVVSRGAALAVDETDEPFATPTVVEEFEMLGEFDENDLANLTVEDAQALVEQYPDNEGAYMLLSFAYLNANDEQKANETLTYVLTEMNPSAEMLAQSAQITSLYGFSDDAILLWLAAYERSPENADIRNNAGQYIYRQINTASRDELGFYANVAAGYPESAFAKTMEAQARIAAVPAVAANLAVRQREQIEQAVQAALAVDDLAETHLIYGNYYELIKAMEQAESEWRLARSYADAPEWVKREANVKLSQLESTETEIEGQ